MFEHLDELADVILRPEVYLHIEATLPSRDDFMLGLSRAIKGPELDASDQLWLNYLVREAGSRAMLGRLEATVHHDLAEIAFLFGPQYWGQGFASEGLLWLHTEVTRVCQVSAFWATTVPANSRCQALLLRNSYGIAKSPFPPLLSYDDGDLVFKRASTT